MEVVALVSGGKDSCFAMLKCIEYGHKIVALANLMPVDDSVDELDSYMYQTVGHQIVESYAVCMGLPLFRRRICGSARLQNLKYDETPGDEVEDMFLLLSEIKRKVPTIAAVCSGAIASDYQRLRVENVCSRLGLVSLAYLWKQDQSLLLQEMISKGIVAIFVKVAAMGLYPSKHLGQELSSLQNLLHELKESFGINVCGEGGEYETLTIDCPLFKNAKIVLDDVQIVMYSSDSIAPVGALHPSAFHLEAKSSLCINNELNDEGKNISCVHEVEGDSKSLACYVKHPPMDFQFKEDSIESGMLNISKTRGTDFSVGCWIQNSNKTADLAYVLWKIETELQQGGFSWKDVLYIHLYLSDMGQFAVANKAYLNFITDKACHLGVPSRCTVELPLVEAGLGHAYVEVRVANATSKRVLHVQSISSWAPSCIGPYSQATLDKEVLHMAGQLGLDPPTMTLCSGGAINELEQAVKNCEAVAQEFNCHITSSAILVVIYCSASSKLSERTEIQNKEAALFRKHLQSEVKPKEDCRVLHPIFLYVLVPGLPIGALVEVKPLLYVPDTEDALSPVVLCERDTRLSKLWGIEQIDRQDLCLQSCIINGKISALILSITKSEAEKLHLETGKLLKVNNADFGTENPLRRVARFCVCILDEILLQYNNSWQEVKSLRFYFNVSFCKDANLLRGLFSEAFDELAAHTQRLNRSSLDMFNVIPVLGSGRTTAMEDLITCELFVSKL